MVTKKVEQTETSELQLQRRSASNDPGFLPGKGLEMRRKVLNMIFKIKNLNLEEKERKGRRRGYRAVLLGGTRDSDSDVSYLLWFHLS